MMNSGWMTPATLVSGWSAIAATVACWIAWKVFRWQREADIPVISAVITPCPGQPSLTILVVGAENRGNTGWTIESARNLHGSVRMATHLDVEDCAFNGAGSISLEQFSESATRFILPLNVHIPSAGTTEGGIGRVAVPIYFRIDPAFPSSKLSMRLSIASMEPTQRRRTIAIKRTLRADIPNAQS